MSVSIQKKAYAALFIAVIAVSFAAVFIVSTDSPPLSIAFYRLFFTTLIILPIVILHKPSRDEVLSLSPKLLVIMTLIGIVLAAHFSLWISSLTKTSVASSVILVTAHPLLVGLISHFFLKEHLSKINTLGIGLSVSGVIVLVLGNYELSSLTLEGNILALLGGIAAGLYILGGRKIRKTVSLIPYVFMVYATSTISLLIICLIFDAPVYNLGMRNYGLILLMAAISGILGHTVYNWALRYVRASVASVSLLGEPIGSTVLALVIPWIHQVPTIYTLIGGVIILSGIYLTTHSRKEN